MNIKNIIRYILPYGILVFKNKYLTINIFNNIRKFNKKYKIRDNSVLLIEFQPFHGETLPGLIRYLLDLDYNVDIILCKNKKKGRNSLELFSCFNENIKLNIYIFSAIDINLLLRSPIVYKYKNIIINTFTDEIEKKYLYKVDIYKLKPICLIHNPNLKNNYFIKSNKIISLVNMDYINRKSSYIVSSIFYCNFQKKVKSNKTIFITLNSNDLYRRNLNLLFKACDKLFEIGITYFTVKIIGNGITIPEKYNNNFQIYGFLDFEKMYKEIIDSDFLLALLDQASIGYTNKASGSYLLSYGFLKPIVLHNKFSDISGFNEKNSILYNNNDNLANAMINCINMSSDEYSSLMSELEISKNKLYSLSLNNLKKVIDSDLE